MLTALYLVYFGYTPPGIFHIAMNNRRTILDTASPIEPASNPKSEHNIRGFLQRMNSGEGKPVAVVATSSAVNSAAVSALKCKLEGGPARKGQLLFCPETDANFETSSYDEYAEGYLVTKNMMKWFWDNHVPDLARRREVYASPLQAGIDQLKGLPPAHIQVAGNDVLRDEGVAYARKLDAAAVECRLLR